MNNYQLNNTSVYLGGQCRWDIAISKIKGGSIEVTGFQLAPLSDSIPYNKHADNITNTPHSENLKNFYNDIKENFWDISSNIDQYSRFDPTYLAGAKRLPQYGVYGKQIGYLQPVWLECLTDSYLKFEFQFFTVNEKGERGNLLDFKSLYLKPNGKGDYHDKFISYFYNWLKYVGILNTSSDFDSSFNLDDFGSLEKGGNDKVIDISIKDMTSTIEGINVTTGQRSYPVDVSYIIRNLVSQERTLMESDYIISSSFQSHYLIVSQLLNLNFCFNLTEMLDPFIYNTFAGKRISVECYVSVMDSSDNEIPLSRRSLFTNYQYIDKYENTPYVQAADCDVDYTEGVIKEEYTYHDEDPKDTNVLSYLKDYDDYELHNKNKLVQHICHWSYIGDDNKSFNLYNGFSGIVFEPSENSNTNSPYGSIRIVHHGELPSYPVKSYYTNGVNENAVIELNSKFAVGRGDFTWINPGKLLEVLTSGSEGLNDAQRVCGSIGKYFEMWKDKYSISIQKAGSYWNSDNTPISPSCSLLCLYIPHVYNLIAENMVFQYNLFKSDDTDNDFYKYTNSGDNEAIVIGYNERNNTFIVISTVKDWVMLKWLIENADTIEGAQYLKDFGFKDFVTTLGKTILLGNDGYYYIPFKKELGIGYDELGRQVYYKTDNQLTFVYRRGGKLSPMSKDDIWCNNIFFLDVDDDEPVEADKRDGIPVPDTKATIDSIPETKWPDGGWIMLLSETLNFVLSKEVNVPITLTEMIKEKIKEIYKLSDYVSETNMSYIVDYIYKLYNIENNYEYASETDVKHVIYTVKMTLI